MNPIDILFKEVLEESDIIVIKSNSSKYMFSYLFAQLLRYPKMAAYLNENVNNMYRLPRKGIDAVKFYRKLFNDCNIKKKHLKYLAYPQKQEDRLRFADNVTSTGDSIVIHDLVKNNIVEETQDRVFDNKKSKITKKDKLAIQEAIDRKKEKSREKKLETGKYIKKLTQELIDQEGLQLLHITDIKGGTEMLYIFLNKDQKKKYYIEPWRHHFKYSKKTSIMDNDYWKSQKDLSNYDIKSKREFRALTQAIEKNFQKEANV